MSTWWWLYIVSVALVLGLSLAESRDRKDVLLSFMAAPVWPFLVAYWVAKEVFRKTTFRAFPGWTRIVSEVATGPTWYWRGVTFRKYGIGILKVKPRKSKEED